MIHLVFLFPWLLASYTYSGSMLLRGNIAITSNIRDSKFLLNIPLDPYPRRGLLTSLTSRLMLSSASTSSRVYNNILTKYLLFYIKIIIISIVAYIVLLSL